MHQGGEHGAMSPEIMRKHYLLLGINLLISLAIMYIAMFAMIASWGAFIQNINFFYMALVMWAPMGVLMLLTMRMMYRDKRLNMILFVAFGTIFLLSLIGIRQQSLVGDDQFLRSMIPHHSGAILMCEKSSIRDPEIKQLCQGIIASQSSEIAQMKAMLARR
jgi:asparagine N-glycosylation enzyme membrane subunit Stt3